MAEVTPPAFLQGSADHPAKLFRRALQGLVREGVTSFNADGDMKVVESSPAAMSVRVQRGGAFVQGDDTTDQGVYFAYNDGYEAITVPAADGTNPRKDIIVAQIKDATEGVAGDTWALELIEGTPAGSPSEPATPASALKLATIDVLAGASSITNARITDRRTGAGPYMGGAAKGIVATSQTRNSTSYGDLATVGPSASVVIGPSGLALVILHAKLDNSGANTSRMSFAVSGATTVAASDVESLAQQGSNTVEASGVFMVTGLTPGTNVFTAKYRVHAGTGTFSNRQITVIPL